MMKTTHEERVRIRAWLEKDPQSRDKDKILVLPRGDKDNLRLTRTTNYFGNNWKVRIAYEIETDYPILMSSPIPADNDSKKKNPKAAKMVPKLPKSSKILPDIPVSNKTYTFNMVSGYNWGTKAGYPTSVSKKAVKGSKAVYGAWDTLFVMPHQKISEAFYQSKLAAMTVPTGYTWKPSASGDYYLVKK